MITIITEKPCRSVEIKGYGLDFYTDTSTGKRVYRVYGIIEAGTRARLVPRDSEDPKDIKDLYIDDAKIIIYRNEDRKLAMVCKDMLDRHVAQGATVFGVEAFKQWLANPQLSTEQETPKEEVKSDAN